MSVNQLKLWNVNAAYKSVKTFQYNGSVLTVLYSLDGKNLINGSRDHTIGIWDISTGQCVKILEGHLEPVWSIALSPDGRILASGSEDKTIRIWDVLSGKCLKTLSGHQHLVKSITFHPVEPVMVSGSLDETMKVWDIHTGECLQTLRVERPYEGMNITGTTGLTEAQKATLKALGAVEINSV